MHTTSQGSYANNTIKTNQKPIWNGSIINTVDVKNKGMNSNFSHN